MLLEIEVPIDGSAACGGAMVVLAWLAYPKREDESKRQHFMHACKSLLLRRYRWARSDSRIRPRLAKLDPKSLSLKGAMARREVTNELSRADRLIRKRLVAADMQAPQCLKVFHDRFVPIAGKMIRLRIKGASTRKLATAVARESRQDPEDARVNVTSRIWSESKPVMHLAAALRLWLRQQVGKKIEVGIIGNAGQNRQLDLGDLHLVRLVCCPDWLGEVILWAEAFRMPVNGTYTLPGMNVITVRFLPAD